MLLCEAKFTSAMELVFFRAKVKCTMSCCCSMSGRKHGSWQSDDLDWYNVTNKRQ